MHLEFTEEERSFREEVQAFLRERLPDDIRRKVRNGEALGRRAGYLAFARLRSSARTGARPTMIPCSPRASPASRSN